MKALSFIEIDVPSFAGGSPEEIVTYRFATSSDYLPTDIDSIPSIASIGYTPSRISLGKDLGERATLSVSLMDHRHVFNGEPFGQGTFWGKWRARYGQRLRGRPLRWIQGLAGQPIEAMETRHFIVDSTDGPDNSGVYQISAKDALKLADGDRAQAPLLSSGFLVSAIDADDTGITLSPAGIGNFQYPASGWVAIGGEEMCAFTRSGDSMTLTRGQLGTTGVAHEAGDRVQLILRYTGEDPADILRDLLVTYAGIPDEWIPIGAWKLETATYLQRLYTAIIPEPVAVGTLISELIEQAALAMWWEPLQELIRLQVLRAIPTTADRFTPANVIEGSLRLSDQPSTRISQVWTYFGPRNALRPVDETDNYRSVAVTVDLEAEGEYGSPLIKKIFSRWIPFGGRQVALRVNEIQIGRYRDPPRKVSFDLFRYGPENPQLGGGYQIEGMPIQDMLGQAVSTPIQITRLNPATDRHQIEAEEAFFRTITPEDLTDRVIIIDSAAFNVNLREMHDSIYPDPSGDESPQVTVTVYIESSVIVGSLHLSLPAIDVGSWPDGIAINIVVRGRIQGRGGTGGLGGDEASGSSGGPGGQGGRALYTRYPITLTLNDGGGQVWGGGGGGGGGGRSGGGGGGGAGTLGGEGGGIQANDGEVGFPGTSEAGGAGGDGANPADLDGGSGGGPGLAGQVGQGSLFAGAGGAAGVAIDGLSYVTKVGTGDVRGQQVN